MPADVDNSLSNSRIRLLQRRSQGTWYSLHGNRTVCIMVANVLGESTLQHAIVVVVASSAETAGLWHVFTDQPVEVAVGSCFVHPAVSTATE